MNKDDRDLIDLALSWEPYGGPPGEETMLGFGLTEDQFRDRVRQILSTRGISTDELLIHHARVVLSSYRTPRVPAQPSSNE